ncbi:MAG: hypothetical protein ACK5TO_07765 [Planctomycetaceae bacterium]
MTRLSRRNVLQAAISAALTGGLLPGSWPSWLAGAENERLPVAVVGTVYTKNSHADVLAGKILEGWQQDGGAGPGLRVVSLWVDQAPEGELSRGLAEKHGFRWCQSIDEALTLGTDHLQVAGVLSIGEHGNYPYTSDTQQHQYPRRRFLEGIAATFRRVGQSVPVFNDKHLGYRFEDARAMVELSRELKFPLLAGSSLPVAWRVPGLDLPFESEIEGMVSVGYGGLEAYGFHALEMHQCLLERRRGGETGVKSVRTIPAAQIFETAGQGVWSRPLLEAALTTLPAGSTPAVRDWKLRDDAAVYDLEHVDGLRTAVVMANGPVGQFCCALKLKGRAEPVSTWFKLQENAPFGHFAYLLRAIEQTIRQGKTVYPVERTLLTTGILDRVMQSHAKHGDRIETPELGICYTGSDWPYANHPDSPLQLPND